MKHYQVYLFTLKILFMFGLFLTLMNKIPRTAPLYVIIDTVFKISLGIMIIWFFKNNKGGTIDKHDRMLFMIAGVLLILGINYKEVLHAFYGEDASKASCTSSMVKYVDKPCPICQQKISTTSTQPIENDLTGNMYIIPPAYPDNIVYNGAYDTNSNVNSNVNINSNVNRNIN